MVGELYIGGPGVAKGYRNLPVQTKAKFIIYQNKRVYRTGDYAKFDNDGNVVILGRLDGQIKLRGLRIELGEIENVIQSYGSIKEAAIAGKTIGGVEHLAAMYKGKRDHQNADKAFTFSIGFGSVASATMMLIGMLLVQPTTMIFSQGGSLYQMTFDYLIPLWASAPIMTFSMGTSTHIRTDGMQKLAGALPVVSNVINLGLDYVFMAIFGWGVAGAGWATVTGYAFGMLLIPYFRSKAKTVHFTKVRKSDFKVLGEVIKTGLPTALTHACQFVRTIAINAVILATAGTVGMQIVTICLSALNIALIFINSTSMTLMPICGALFSEKDNSGVRYVLRISNIITIVMSMIILAILMLFPAAVGNMFVPLSAEVSSQLVVALRIFSLCILLTGIAYVLRSFYQSTKQNGAASLFTVLEGVVFIVPLKYIFAYTNQNLMWLSFALAEIASILVIVVIMQIVAKHKKKKNFLMLDTASEQDLLDMTIQNDIEKAVEVSKEIIVFCDKNHVDPDLTNVLAVSSEELAVNIVKYAYKGKNEIDVCLRILEDKLVLRFRDNGIIFNPTKYIDESGREITGLSVVRSITPDITYNRVLGFNVTVVTVATKES